MYNGMKETTNKRIVVKLPLIASDIIDNINSSIMQGFCPACDTFLFFFFLLFFVFNL